MSNRYGLIGYPLGHSFSKRYFTAKFERESIPDSKYELFPLPEISQFPALLNAFPDLKGLNVTIPHKQGILPYLNKLDKAAADIGAVNTIRFTSEGELWGYNTDWLGFQDALLDLLPVLPERALILGTGGSSKAVQYALHQLSIPFQLVSRSAGQGVLSYEMLTEEIIHNHRLIINSTPLGMSPDVNSYPEIPYSALTPEHLLFDLVYNPAETAFMKLGREVGTLVCNGEQMLYAQAEAAWKIWNS